MYQLDQHNHFIIDNFQNKQTFSSFLPGVAGKSGLPIWAFYVNRGQGIASFGVQDKDHAILEFLPADKSYQLVQTQGFRTFIKMISSDETIVVEPFSPYDIVGQSRMEIAENMLTLYYHHPIYQFDLTINYYTLPHTPVAGLVRDVTFTNLGQDTRTFEILDGLPSILPSGVENAAYKELGNTLKSWFDVKNLENNIPFYFLRGSTKDSAEVKAVHEGNFYYSVVNQNGKAVVIQPIIDKQVIFGQDTTLLTTVPFNTTPLEELTKMTQQTTNRVSGGFTPIDIELQSEETVNWTTVVGYATNLKHVNQFVKTNLNYSMLQDKKQEAKVMTDHITAPMTSSTNEPLFDAYSKQSYLDNGLRGGFPYVFSHDEKDTLYYLYSRKHGDLERDYNFFSLSPTFYSQGNGNYRDINQNRRCDVFFEPKVKDYNIKMFMNLIQLDGYNPLGVKGVRFSLRTDQLDWSKYISQTEKDMVLPFFKNSFTPGELKHFVEDKDISLKRSFDAFLAYVLSGSEEDFEASFNEGYWVDHWTYNLDLIDSYLAIYPDQTDHLYFTRDYRYFKSPTEVKKREDKYVLTDGKLRQYDALSIDKNQPEADWVKTKKDPHHIYRTDLFTKLFTLGLVKTATLAPFGLGIEMEADKPGWNDSLNGLPGMIGSSTSELYELKRLFDLLLSVSHTKEVALPVEVSHLLDNVLQAIRDLNHDVLTEQAYWHTVATYREDYRQKIYQGISGDDVVYTTMDLLDYVHELKGRIKQAIDSVETFHHDLIPTYFYFEAKPDSIQLTEENKLNIEQLVFEPKAVTPFLEGVVKSLKLKETTEEAEALYHRVKQSEIFDKKLKMYKTSMSIKDEPNELGRASAFTPGWLENESVFLHMAYKYLLATLKKGLVEEFFTDMKTGLIPFLDPAVYGRSTLENSSFIASSANPDPDLHGRGFVARLSGSTIEFMNMWFVMMTGGEPFSVEDGLLTLSLSPQLPSWLFKENGELTTTFLGKTKILYKNEQRKNTYGKSGVKPTRYVLTYRDGSTETIESRTIKGDTAHRIRENKAQSILCELN